MKKLSFQRIIVQTVLLFVFPFYGLTSYNCKFKFKICVYFICTPVNFVPDSCSHDCLF
ncbi:unnamed protein product [Amoebophrya sp. A120]|nr:unnamed protein product [Amoebophrya sp. A120]|eukprot:GSA120T00026302001.1